MKKRLNYLLIVLCLLIASACKNGAVTADSGKDEGAGGCEGEKAKAILWVDYKKGRPIPRGVAIKTGNYIQAGEQYLQLRYIPSWMK